MNKRFLSILLAGVLASGNMMAQGMWIPSKAKTENYAEMKEFGLQLTPDQVYSTEEASLKDAIIRLNGGMCSAEFISSQGLVLTNHHCGYDGVASLSSVEHDYLTNGFWAYSKGEELSIPDYFVSLLVRIEDVTDQILGSDRDEKNPQVIQQRSQEIVTKAQEGGKYKVDLKPMFAGNEYFIYVYEDYKDVRLVGAPPSSIGKYGGDTDNWMWPRHTGDFTLLRVYMKADGSASEGYDKGNVPFKPKQYLPVSMKGVGEGDYAMIMGYPGSTDRYLTSDQIQFAMDYSNGSRIDAMGKRLEIMKKYMDKNDTIRIAVASSYASGMNGWKYFIGQNTMLKRYDIPGKKRQEEKDFTKWAVGKGDAKYSNVVGDIGKLYSKEYGDIDRFINYVFYGLMPAQSLNLGRDFVRLKMAMEKSPADKDVAKKGVENIKKRLPEWEKEYFAGMDKDIVTALLIAVKKEVKADLLPPVINEILASKAAKKGKTDEEKFRLWVDNAFATSVVTNVGLRNGFMANPDVKVLQKDPIVTLAGGVVSHFRDKLAPKYYEVQGKAEELAKDYIAGLRLANPDKKFYPDANSSMRLTYGKVKSYDPQDAVHYHYLTTFDGVIAKEDNKNPEFEVPKKLHELWETKNYGQYATVAGADGNMTVPVCFLTTNDITGGNSGSAVINGNGEIIGCAFDGNWEAMAGDIHVFPNLNRTIAVDIRYVLFIIDKFAGAKNIIDELELRK